MVICLQEFPDEVMGHNFEKILPGHDPIPKLTYAPLEYIAHSNRPFKYIFRFKELTEIEK